MVNTRDLSALLILPDEIILEICKYLSNPHVLYSFYGLNQRLNRCISGYFRQISLSDISYDQCQWICERILPEIGVAVRSIRLSNCRSVLQGKMFAQNFAHRMSSTFPNLEKLILICFTANGFDEFLQTLTNFSSLTELEVYDLLTDQSNLFQRVIESNEQRWKSIQFRTSHVDLPDSPCFHLHRLTISLKTIDQLPSLLTLFPRLEYFNVTIDEISTTEAQFDQVKPLIHLQTFILRCYNHLWSLDEIHSLLRCLPIVKICSLQISSQDEQFIRTEQKLFTLLPSSIEQFNLSLRYFYESIEQIDRSALLHARFPLVCLIDEDTQQAVLHTIPYRFPLLNLSESMGKQMSSEENYAQVRTFYDYQGMDLSQTFAILRRCRSIEEITIQSHEPANQSTFTAAPTLGYFHRLKRLWFLHSSREIQSLKLLLQISPNLCELFIGFDNLLPMFDDAESCQLLSTRILHLLVLRTISTTGTRLNEQSIPQLVRIFARLRHLQIDVTHGVSIESIVSAILNTCQQGFHLISLVVEGQCSSDQLKSNARQWLIERHHREIPHRFDAEFRHETNRFLLWT